MTHSAVFLDRDGVINRAIVRGGKPYPPRTLDELEIMPGVLEALQALKSAGFLLFVATNQPDVARGIVPKTLVQDIHESLRARLPLEAVLACFHDDRDGCECRKPLPGLLTSAAREWSIDLSASFMVGDRWRDIEAGQRAGCRTVFIDMGYDERTPESYDYRVASTLDAAQVILRAGLKK